MPDDLEEVFERAHEEQLAMHRAQVRDVRRALESGHRTWRTWSGVGLDWQGLAGSALDRAERALDSALDRAERSLDAVEARFDRLDQAPPHRRDASPSQKTAPAPSATPQEPARSLWDRLSDAEEGSLGTPSAAPSRAQEGARLGPGPWWAPYAVYAAALTLVVALLGWALYSVP